MSDESAPPTSLTSEIVGSEITTTEPLAPEAPGDIAAATAKLWKDTEGSEGFDGLTWDESGRAHRPDGSFATKAEIEAGKVIADETKDELAEAVSSEVPEETAEIAEDEVAEEVPEFKVVLKGHPDRGEEDIELVLPDAESVERYNRAINDGLRKKDYEAKMQTVQQKEAEVTEFFTALEHNPIGTVLNAIPREASLEVAKALVAEHWDALFPDLKQFSEDPTRVRETRLDSRERSMAADREARSAIEAGRRAGAILSATESLVPDSVDPSIKQKFMEDAERDLVRLANRGVAIGPETVAQQLQDRIRMYGFAAQAPVKAVKPVVAKRVGDSPKATPSVEQAKQAQTRTKSVIQAQKTAAAIPPAGRGAAVVRKPLLTGKETIEEATRKLMSQGYDFPSS